MAKIKSKVIINPPIDELDNRRLAKEIGYPHAKLKPALYKVTFEHKTFYCCMAGGEVDANGEDASLTDIGRFTLNALCRLPEKDSLIVLQEIKRGTVPLKEKVARTFRTYPSGAKICFVGDIAGALDGVLFDILNVNGTTEL
jgi:hypothetical protein